MKIYKKRFSKVECCSKTEENLPLLLKTAKPFLNESTGHKEQIPPLCMQGLPFTARALIVRLLDKNLGYA